MYVQKQYEAPHARHPVPVVNDKLCIRTLPRERVNGVYLVRMPLLLLLASTSCDQEGEYCYTWYTRYYARGISYQVLYTVSYTYTTWKYSFVPDLRSVKIRKEALRQTTLSERKPWSVVITHTHQSHVCGIRHYSPEFFRLRFFFYMYQVYVYMRIRTQDGHWMKPCFVWCDKPTYDKSIQQ